MIDIFIALLLGIFVGINLGALIMYIIDEEG